MKKNSGYGRGKGKGDGRGSASGWGIGCGEYIWGTCGGDKGEGDGTGIKEERQKIELNILKNIPDLDLPLYMNIWEFEKTKKVFYSRLKGV